MELGVRVPEWAIRQPRFQASAKIRMNHPRPGRSRRLPLFQDLQPDMRFVCAGPNVKETISSMDYLLVGNVPKGLRNAPMFLRKNLRDAL